jgi:hypothetical protein
MAICGDNLTVVYWLFTFTIIITVKLSEVGGVAHAIWPKDTPGPFVPHQRLRWIRLPFTNPMKSAQ